MTFSFSPDDFTRGLVDDIRARIVAAASFFWAEGGGNPAIKLTLEDQNGKKHEVIYSAGKREFMVPTADYDSFEPAMGKTTNSFNEQSNAGELFRELRTVGVPNDVLKSGSLRRLVGIEAHWKRKAMPKYKDEKGQERDREVLVPTTLYSAGTGLAQGNGQAGAAPAPVGPDPNVAVAQAKIMETLMANGGTMPKVNLATAIWQQMADPSLATQRTGILMLVNQDQFMKSGPWKYENGVVSLG